MARFWPWLLALVLLALGTLAAAWYVANRGDTVEAKAVSVASSGVDVPDTVSRGQAETTTTVVVTTAGPSQGTVPDVVGLHERAATVTIEDAEYRVRVQERTVTDSSQEGIVVQQIPRGGTRRTGTTVTIVVGRLR